MQPLAEIVDYDTLIVAPRARADELEISRETISGVAGLSDRYASKVLSLRRIRRIGLESLGPLLDVLGLKARRRRRRERPRTKSFEARPAQFGASSCSSSGCMKAKQNPRRGMMADRGRKAERWDRSGARTGLVTPGDIIPEWWARSSRNGGRHQIGTVGEIIPEQWAISSGISIGAPLGAVIGGVTGGAFGIAENYMANNPGALSRESIITGNSAAQAAEGMKALGDAIRGLRAFDHSAKKPVRTAQVLPKVPERQASRRAARHLEPDIRCRLVHSKRSTPRHTELVEPLAPNVWSASASGQYGKKGIKEMLTICH